MFFELRVELTEGTTSIVHTMTNIHFFKPKGTFVPTVTAKFPLKVPGVTETVIGDRLVLIAEGEGFARWYTNGGC